MAQQNGQCWQKQKGSEAGTFGYWQACVEEAPPAATDRFAAHGGHKQFFVANLARSTTKATGDHPHIPHP
jgi:hypothetical protein